MTSDFSIAPEEKRERGRPLAQPLLTADEAADLLHVPRSTLYELVRSRGLPHVRIGERGLRFTRCGLEEWVASHTYGRQRR
jgi:excisionase family DNA binding protein